MCHFGVVCFGRLKAIGLRPFEVGGWRKKDENKKAQRKKIHRPDEISVTEISPRINRIRPREISATEISQGRRLTGQVGQAESAEERLMLKAGRLGELGSWEGGRLGSGEAGKWGG